MALVLILLTRWSFLRMPIDVLPDINVPVISVVRSYAGLAPDDGDQDKNEWLETVIVHSADPSHLLHDSDDGRGRRKRRVS